MPSNVLDMSVLVPDDRSVADDAVTALAATIGARTVVIAHRHDDTWHPLAAADSAGLLEGEAWIDALDAVLIAGSTTPVDAWEDLRTVVVAPVPVPPPAKPTVVAVLDIDAIAVAHGHRTLIRAYAELLGRDLDRRRSEPPVDDDNDATVEVLQRRRRFFSEVVHDLRAPMAVIAGNAHLLAVHPDDSERVERHARAITAQVKRMATMVDGLLEAEGRELGHISEEPTEIDLDGFVAVIVEETEQLLTTSDVVVAGEGRGTLHSQRLALHRLVMNLTANAVKSTREGRIEILARESDGGAVFTVRDTGRGIGDEQALRLRDGQPIDYEGAGFGLGLSIVVRLARQLNGTVDVGTYGDGGTSVTVLVPRYATTEVVPALT